MVTLRPSIMSASLGRAWLHDFDAKAHQASKHGFEGIEIFYEDLEHLAKRLTSKETPDGEDILQAARHVHETCTREKLEIIGLQPFLFYEGLVDRSQHARLIEKIHLWFRIAKELQTTIIQIPANFLPADQVTTDINVIVEDLRQLADLGLKESPPIRFVYENLCWSTVNDTWDSAWDVVKRVDRSNFGICLDTFNIAGRVWADPTSPTGKTPNADADLEASLQKMIQEVELEKVFYIQFVDAERLAVPLDETHPFHVPGQPPRMSWSRNARTFAYETDRGAYLPVEKVAKAIIDGLGYQGWVSLELFSRTMAEEGEQVPYEHAKRGMASWKKFQERVQSN
ncbi:unnamed protein product [Clonostachys byssicola]|uniref:Xylose isomerase-like TIM barrel domain-containing protein n=1 Tax=Clonostachys byssicola TaxID=160290 RepID=A0A9N9UGP0_9HYPO|nr:unnamed protein product [Clonostachys byssicola]